MPTNQIFTWKDGGGWLIFSGGNESTGAIRANAIERTNIDGALVCIDFGKQDDVLDDMQDLGAPAGYVVNVLVEDDETIRKQISGAALIVISSDDAPAVIHSNLKGAPLDGLLAAYEAGAVIVFEGNAAVVFASYFEGGEGIGWLSHACLLPEVETLAESPYAQQLIVSQPEVIVLGLAVGAAIAFGSAGQVETWGNRKILVVLGNAYTSG